MDAPSTYGSDIRRRRTARHQSLADLSRTARVDRAYIGQIERGARRGSPDIAAALDRALDAGGALVALYRTTPSRRAAPAPTPAPLPWGHCGPACRGCEAIMTQLSAIVESVRLSLSVGGVGAAEAVEEAVAALAADYAGHAPAVMLTAVADTRSAIGDALTHTLPDAVTLRLQDAAGWTSALLGNLAQHLGRDGDARAHLASAHLLAVAAGDPRLICHVRGVQAMLARDTGRLDTALQLAEDAYLHATTPVDRTKTAAWGRARTLAAMGNETGADAALRDARDAFDGDMPGRFGIDEPELLLHEAETHLALGRADTARRHAEASAGLVATTRPAWAAAQLTAALALHADGDLDGAEIVATDVLDRHEPDRIRATSRRRLRDLVADGRLPALAERVATLPPLAA